MSVEQWRERRLAHADRADRLTEAHRARQLRGEKHPVEDFLFSYYTVRVAELRRWHPGAGISLAGPRPGDAPDADGPAPKWYRGSADGSLRVDAAAFLDRRGRTVDLIERLLRATLDRPARFGCFGLHEWAMVYRLDPEEIRHRGLSLRLGSEHSDRVVQENPIGCTHFDAYRFFTPEAAPLNEERPTRDTQVDTEQAGCLHANMDLYKWAGKLGPLVPGELLLDCFELARDIRRVDMRASPYDVSPYGLEAVRIETPAGKREYARLQRGFTERANPLRDRILDAITAARAAS
ncbi:3-methyladenine DNA glycosylase [Leucobacter sp. M11]|uniref:3-methyladenine DNA glycosylase n=1 Tax=Leucobacter sp. M11 TaxID=2993565 RepID=UPI002D80C5A4|nr:3-methyladenine DNA glycosylase [Leucobacter sp. M11]MEB4615240.1 3-methyladenine DNA glycosylase [Leucobacter sp. M11]